MHSSNVLQKKRLKVHGCKPISKEIVKAVTQLKIERVMLRQKSCNQGANIGSGSNLVSCNGRQPDVYIVFGSIKAE